MTMCRADAMPSDAASVQVGETPYFPPCPRVGTVQETAGGTQ